jgi:hypothetical protein
MKDIGIAIIDVFEQDNLDVCYDSLKDSANDVLIVSNTSNKMPKNCNFERYSGQIPFATLRNYALHHFRIKGLKHFFLINSNVRITDSKVFENAIEVANAFGVWCLFGPTSKNTVIEDDEKNLNLILSQEINSDFIYIHDGIISNVGFFEERYLNTKSLDVLDYVVRMRSKDLYTPNGYVATIQEGLDTTRGKITKPNYKEIEKDPDKSVEFSYAYFLTMHKYIPTQNDPKPVENEKLMETLESLQKNHSNKL